MIDPDPNLESFTNYLISILNKEPDESQLTQPPAAEPATTKTEVPAPTPVSEPDKIVALEAEVQRLKNRPVVVVAGGMTPTAGATPTPITKDSLKQMTKEEFQENKMVIINRVRNGQL